MLCVENTTSSTNGFVFISLKIPGEEQPFIEKFYVVNQVTRHLPFEKFSLESYNEFRSLPLADPKFGTPGEIDALFGVNLWIKILQNGVIKSKDGMVAAQQTSIGWVIYTQENPCNHRNTKYALHIAKTTEKCQSNDFALILEKFWQVEDLPTIKTFTPEEKECERIFQETHKRNKDGRYVVKLPFNEKIPLLGKSKAIALRQFYAMERKMLRNEEFRSKYHEFMREFESLGHLEKINETKESGYYTPHHGVVTSSKFRVVINASCKTTSGISLNECQLVGAKLQSDLANILMKFRSHETAKRLNLTVNSKKFYGDIHLMNQLACISSTVSFMDKQPHHF